MIHGIRDVKPDDGEECLEYGVVPVKGHQLGAWQHGPQGPCCLARLLLELLLLLLSSPSLSSPPSPRLLLAEGAEGPGAWTWPFLP